MSLSKLFKSNILVNIAYQYLLKMNYGFPRSSFNTFASDLSVPSYHYDLIGHRQFQTSQKKSCFEPSINFPCKLCQQNNLGGLFNSTFSDKAYDSCYIPDNTVSNLYAYPGYDLNRVNFLHTNAAYYQQLEKCLKVPFLKPKPKQKTIVIEKIICCGKSHRCCKNQYPSNHHYDHHKCTNTSWNTTCDHNRHYDQLCHNSCCHCSCFCNNNPSFDGSTSNSCGLQKMQSCCNHSHEQQHCNKENNQKSECKIKIQSCKNIPEMIHKIEQEPKQSLKKLDQKLKSNKEVENVQKASSNPFALLFAKQTQKKQQTQEISENQEQQNNQEDQQSENEQRYQIIRTIVKKKQKDQQKPIDNLSAIEALKGIAELESYFKVN